MYDYQRDDLLKLAKRSHNIKRTYLLVDPLQGKHIPVSPTASLQMLQTLGERLRSACGEIDVVIGFAETATAVGAVIAACQGPECRYIHTTREPYAMIGEKIEFLEEHSHATEQILRTGQLKEWLERARAIAFADDELSTGKTLMNMSAQLESAFPCIREKKRFAVSIIDRLTDERRKILSDNGIECVSLLHLPFEDYTDAVKNIVIEDAQLPEHADMPIRETVLSKMTADPRMGTVIGDYIRKCRAMSEVIIKRLRREFMGSRILVLGTEEYMLPGLLLGKQLETEYPEVSVYFHASTRSPIGISGAPGYPIRSGYRLHSFYEDGRVTYIYDTQAYDTVVILTDSPDSSAAHTAFEDLASALKISGCENILLVREKDHVQYI